VRFPVEALVALLGPRGATEVVKGDRVVPGGGETLGQLDVEAVEPAHVGEDDHPGAARLGRRGQRGGELVAVRGGQDQRLGGGPAGDDSAAVGQLRRPGIELEAHRVSSR
jgi:hypothetical protein